MNTPLIQTTGFSPSISAQSESQVSVTGESVTICIEAEGTAPLQFSWLHGHMVVEGADGPVLTFTEVTEADSGSYQCLVKNRFGQAVSKPSKIEVGKLCMIAITHVTERKSFLHLSRTCILSKMFIEQTDFTV